MTSDEERMLARTPLFRHPESASGNYSLGKNLRGIDNIFGLLTQRSWES